MENDQPGYCSSPAAETSSCSRAKGMRHTGNLPKGKRIPFDDAAVARRAIEGKARGGGGLMDALSLF